MELVEHPPSVVIVALDGDDLVLVRQSRPGSDERTLEIPSGKLEPGESPHEAAVRELAEECGLAATVLQELGTFWAVPAYSQSTMRMRFPSSMKFAFNRSLWHGARGGPPRRRSISPAISLALE